MTDTTQPTVGTIIAAAMRARGYTRQRLACALNCTSAAVGLWLSGDRIPRDETLRAMADKLKLNGRDLVTAAIAERAARKAGGAA